MFTTTFDQIAIDEIFFEGTTGEYYVKKSESSAWVYVISEDSVFLDNSGQIMQCKFPKKHIVETV